jgi:hypothetical protein
MPRVSTLATDPTAMEPLPVAPVVSPNAVFTVPQAQRTLRLAAGTLPREIRLRRLRVAKRAGRYFVLGAWLLEWLEAGEVRREERPASREAVA